jgi:hypothetical protein
MLKEVYGDNILREIQRLFKTPLEFEVASLNIMYRDIEFET